MTVPPGHLHGMRNTSAAPAALRITGRPGAETEFGLRLKFELSRDGYGRLLDALGIPRPAGS